MPGNENTKSGILQGLFICHTSELKPRYFVEKKGKIALVSLYSIKNRPRKCLGMKTPNQVFFGDYSFVVFRT